MDAHDVPAERGVFPAPWAVRLRAAWRALFGASLGWRDPTYLADKPGEERALRFIAMLLFIQRASYLVLAVAGVTSRDHRSPGVNIVLVTVAVAWNAGLAIGIGRRGWFPRWTVTADVAVACMLIVAGTVNCPPDQVFTSLNWPPKLGYGTAALIGAALPPSRGIVVWLVLIAARLGALVLVFGHLPLPVDGIVGVLDSYFWFAVALHFMRRYLCGQARLLDETAHRQVVLEGRRAADRARYAERIRQYRKLHDTVLATLTAIARGGLDHRVAEVRRRCATDADYVRRMVQEDASGRFTTLGATLADVIATAETLGIRVHYLHDQLPADLPALVMEAIADASREALNNVAAHSGVTVAWLTAVWDDDTLTLRIVDRGRGFDPETMVPGFGLRSSIIDRMREVGGSATLFGVPGDGACVELVWPADQSG